jgi:hypothetical protein
LQQGVPASNRLQLFDIYGRLLKNFASIPDKIDVSLFAPGVVIYRLLNDENMTVETGKIIIQ